MNYEFYWYLNEIGRENNKSLDEIKKEFFDDLKNYYEATGQERKERNYKVSSKI